MLNFEYLKKNADISKFKQIIIQGGEPFCCKEVIDFFDYAIEKNVRVSFLTNGLLLNEELAEKIVRNSVFIHISLNAATKETQEKINCGSKWEKVLANVQMLRRYKESLGKSLEIKVHMTIIKENIQEIPLFLEKFHEFGFDVARFGYDKSIPLYLEDNLNEKEQLKEKISAAIANNKEGIIDTTRLEMLDLLKR